MMNRKLGEFLVKTSVFASAMAVVVFAMCWIASTIISRADYRLCDGKHILILGDSHTECVIDDQIFSGSINVAQGGVGYLYSKVVLREMLESNPQIDTVLLSFHPTALTDRYDKILYNKERSSFKLPVYISLMHSDDIAELNVSYLDIAMAYIKNVMKAVKLVANHSNYEALGLGGYLHLDRDKLDVDRKKYDTGDLPTDTDPFNRLTIQWRQLQQIASICRDRGVTLILFDTPKHSAERTEIRSLFYEQMADNLPSEFKYVDYSDFELDDSCYGDIAHLNYRGAQHFSRYLQQNGIK